MRLILFFAIFLGIGTAAFANMCEADKAKFCADKKTKADVVSCLNAHKGELSPPCQHQRDSIAALKHSCNQDIKTLCKGKTNVKQIRQCLNKQTSQLSKGCRSQIRNERLERRKNQKARAEQRRKQFGKGKVVAPAPQNGSTDEKK